MPITITITDPTPEQIAALFGLPKFEVGFVIDQPASDEPKPKATRTRPVTKVEDGTIAVSGEDAELAREIAADIAEAQPEPAAARQIVDAGTGKPIAAPAAEVELTMDEVRANATRLAQANSAQLKAILGEFGAAKLSEVPPEQLPDFAAQVLKALG